MTVGAASDSVLGGAEIDWVPHAIQVDIDPVGAYRRSSGLGHPLSGGIALTHDKHQALGASG
jgi:hypothetical protein